MRNFFLGATSFIVLTWGIGALITPSPESEAQGPQVSIKSKQLELDKTWTTTKAHLTGTFSSSTMNEVVQYAGGTSQTTPEDKNQLPDNEIEQEAKKRAKGELDSADRAKSDMLKAKEALKSASNKANKDSKFYHEQQKRLSYLKSLFEETDGALDSRHRGLFEELIKKDTPTRKQLKSDKKSIKGQIKATEDTIEVAEKTWKDSLESKENKLDIYNKKYATYQKRLTRANKAYNGHLLNVKAEQIGTASVKAGESVALQAQNRSLSYHSSLTSN